MDTTLIKQALLGGGYVEEADIARGEAYVKENGGTLPEYLFEHELVTKSILAQAIAEFYGVPYAPLEDAAVSKELLSKIPESVARASRVVLVVDGKTVTLATDTPKQAIAPELAGLFPGKKITLAYALPEVIDTALLAYRSDIGERFAAMYAAKKNAPQDVVNSLIEDAILLGTSDIHFEPGKKDTLIRLRIDGVLHEALRVEKEYYTQILNRIKVLANLRIDEHATPQDGAIRYEDEGREADLRVSIVPVTEGEKIVIRILSHYLHGLALTELGLSEGDQALLTRAANEPFGLILTVGPTGSGKTTTLYALLELLESTKVNITTIEDPVEYRMEGVNQIQVNQETGLTFGRGLRSIVRQDPNVILVGEIRDLETAEISINAGLTGHLVLSTFHANNAVGSVPRLLNMGIEGFLLSSTLKLVIGQRLVRRNCTSCRKSAEYDVAGLEKTYPGISAYLSGKGTKKKVTLYDGAGCAVCNHTGFKGRIGVYELLPISDAVRDAITKDVSERDLAIIAQKEGVHTMFDDGIAKVISGETTIAELTRIIPLASLAWRAS